MLLFLLFHESIVKAKERHLLCHESNRQRKLGATSHSQAFFTRNFESDQCRKDVFFCLVDR